MEINKNPGLGRSSVFWNFGSLQNRFFLLALGGRGGSLSAALGLKPSSRRMRSPSRIPWRVILKGNPLPNLANLPPTSGTPVNLWWTWKADVEKWSPKNSRKPPKVPQDGPNHTKRTLKMTSQFTKHIFGWQKKLVFPLWFTMIWACWAPLLTHLCHSFVVRFCRRFPCLQKNICPNGVLPLMTNMTSKWDAWKCNRLPFGLLFGGLDGLGMRRRTSKFHQVVFFHFGLRLL